MAKLQKIALAENLITDVCVGRHRTTTRIGEKYADLKPGPAVLVSSRSGTQIPVTITKIEKKLFSRLGKRDAEQQNTTVEELKNKLKNIYNRHARVTGKTQTYLIHFEAPDLSDDIKGILDIVSAQLTKNGFENLADRTKLSVKPNYSINGDNVVSGTNHEFTLSVHNGDAIHYHDVISAALGSEEAAAALTFSTKGKKGHESSSVTLRGDLSRLKQKLEAACPQPKGIISKPSGPL